LTQWKSDRSGSQMPPILPHNLVEKMLKTKKDGDKIEEFALGSKSSFQSKHSCEVSPCDDFVHSWSVLTERHEQPCRAAKVECDGAYPCSRCVLNCHTQFCIDVSKSSNVFECYKTVPSALHHINFAPKDHQQPLMRNAHSAFLFSHVLGSGMMQSPGEPTSDFPQIEVYVLFSRNSSLIVIFSLLQHLAY
jgi:hypothetical protein